MEKFYENLSKLATEMKLIQKTSSEPDFYKFRLDFGTPGGRKHIKNGAKKHTENSKKWEAKKHKKNKKRLCWD